MKKKVWEFLPGGIALALILSILAVLLSLMNQQNPPASSIPTNPTTGNNENVDNGNNDNPDEIVVEPYFTEYPKNSYESDVFLYEQNISGYGNVHIKKIHQTTLGLYAIVETDAKFGDISVERNSVAIAKINLLGVIEKIFVLPSRFALTYIASQITAEGLIVMSKNENNLLLFTVDYTLNQSQTESLPYAEKGRLFPSEDGYIILAEGNRNTIYSKNNGELKTGFLPNGEIIDIYDFYNYLMIFINHDNGYSVLKLSTSLRKIEEKQIGGSKIKAISPFYDGGQKFFVAEKTASGTKLWKYDNTFNKSNAIYTELGNVENLMLFPQDNKVIAIFTGAVKGIYSFNSDLDCSLINNEIMQNITNIYDYNIMPDKCFLLCNTSEGLQLINCNYSNNNYSSINIDDNDANSLLVINTNNTVSVFYECIDQFENSYVNIICSAL